MTAPARRTLDLSRLPVGGFGSHGLWYWAGCAFMLIEGAGFALAIATYIYLMNSAQHWPLASDPPSLLWGTLQTVLLLGSVVPALILSRAARRRDRKATQAWAIPLVVLNFASIVIRGFEFPALNTRWDQDAYGSITWALMLLHTTHLLTDFIDTLFLTVMLFTHPLSTDRYSDVDDDVVYWIYVVLVWIPIYLVVYWAPRWGA
jgi:heme/copper-type cytochrome/quinol oxidase subunit 3